jgi:hypothetical protein
MLAAKADLAKVQEAIDRGQWDQAKSQLTEVSSLVQSIDDPASKQELTDQLKLLNAKVESRNPNATLPVAVATPPVAPPAASTAIPAAPPAASVAPPPAATPSPSPSVGKHHHHGHTPPPVAPLAPNQ